MPSKSIPEADSLLRYVPHAKLRRDESGTVLGVLPDAFKLRGSERDLSATWVDFFPGGKPERIAAAVRVMRGSLKVSRQSGFALGIVANIAATANKHGETIRVLHEEEPNNPAHVAIHRWPAENGDLFDELADDSWSEVILNQAVDS